MAKRFMISPRTFTAIVREADSCKNAYAAAAAWNRAAEASTKTKKMTSKVNKAREEASNIVAVIRRYVEH